MKKKNDFRTWLRSWDEGSFDFSSALSEEGSASFQETQARSASDPSKQTSSGKAEMPVRHLWKETPVYRIEKRQIRHFRRIYPWAALFLAVIMSLFLLVTVASLPPFGSPDAPSNNEVTARYIEKGLEETGAVNVVAGVILDYRAFDTLGESHVLYAAAAAVFILLLTAEGQHEPKHEQYILQSDPLLKSTCRITVPLVMIYGTYVILNGHLGPGGGFSGGAVLGAGLILYALIFGFDRLNPILNLKLYRTIVLCALCFYSLAKGYSFFCGANHLETIFSTGIPGEILSAGLILPLNAAVGIVVACTMYGFYSIFQRGQI